MRVTENLPAGQGGNRITETVYNAWPEAAAFYVTTAYDALNRPTAIRELGATNLATYAYDDLSRRTTVTLGNGTTTTYGYTPQGALASLAHNLAGTAQDVSFTYTRNQAQEITGHNWNNDLYQWAGYTIGTKSYTTNGLNRYTNAAGAAISYDSNGNLTGDGTWTYTFDADNKLKSAAKTGYSATLAYDPEGRLSQTTLAGATTQLLYDGIDLVAEYNGAGTSTATYSYGPYGEPNVATGVRFRYTGQQFLGDLNLYYYKARFYSPALGRFLQTDPIGTADDLNLYAYVGNNPVNFTDPNGLTAADAMMLASTLAGTSFGRGVQGIVDSSPSAGNFFGWMVGKGLENAANSPLNLPMYDAQGNVVGYVGVGPGVIGRAGAGAQAARGLGRLPGPATDKAGNQIGRVIVDSKGNAMIEPVGGKTVAAGKGGVDTHTLYPNGSNYQRLNPQGHGNNPTPHGHGHAPGTGPGMKGQGPSLDVNGNVVPWNSPAAHWPIN